MDKRLGSALITAVREAGVELKKINKGDTYSGLREVRKQIVKVAKDADRRIAEFGDERSQTNHRVVICPCDSELNFKHDYFGAYSVMIGYFEGGMPMFSAIYFPQSQIVINATRGSGTQIDGTRVTAQNGDRIATRLIGGFFDSFVTLDKRAEREVALIDSQIIDRIMEKSAGFRSSGSIGSDALMCLRGQIGGIVSPYLEPERRSVFLALSEAGIKVTDFEGSVVSIDSSSIIAASTETHNELLNLVKSSG